MRRAAARDVHELLLLTQPDMRAAQHLYAEAGFQRLPHRDYEYAPGHHLLAFGLPMADGGPTDGSPTDGSPTDGSTADGGSAEG